VLRGSLFDIMLRRRERITGRPLLRISPPTAIRIRSFVGGQSSYGVRGSLICSAFFLRVDPPTVEDNLHGTGSDLLWHCRRNKLRKPT
jgi:hypothetical protein